MPLITLEEATRGLCIAVFGGAAGVCTLVFPGSPLWLVPAAAAVGGCALTVPEVRVEVARALPALTTGAQRARAALPRAVRGLPGGASRRRAAPAPAQRPTGASEREPLFTALEDQPHRLVIGHTRGGKTTLIHELATQWAARGERVLVADPDAAPGLWPGCEVRGAGDDVPAIGEIFAIVAGEVEARRLARAQGVRHFAPLHVVIDEAQDVLPALAGGLELFEDVARRGGKLNIRMTVGVQDKQVKTLGLEGKSALLRNFQVADVLKARDGRRVAVLRDPETGAKVPMAIPELPDPERLIVPRATTQTTENLRGVSVPRSTPSPADSLLAALLAEGVPSASGRPGNALNVNGVPIPVPNGNGNGNEHRIHSQLTVMPGNAPEVRITVDARAEAVMPPPAGGPRGRGRARGLRSMDVRNRRLATIYRQSGADGVPFAQIYARYKGAKRIVFPAWQRGHAQYRERVGNARSSYSEE